MLFLKPPFHIIEGVAVFADHENERQFYYMPAMPKLTSTFDPDVGMDIPQIQLLKFRGGAAGNGGFLTFEVNLGIEPERLETVAAQLKQIHQLRDQPILAPVVLEDGNVRLHILGQATPTPPPGGGPAGGGQPPAAATPSRYVLKLQHAARPALYGDNQAIFSVELDQEGTELVEASLQGELMPIGVIYALDFFALRPAFTVKVSADWDRVQTHFQETFTAGVFFASTEVDKVVDKLIEEQVINIEVDSFLPEDEQGGSWVGRRDQAISDFKDMVLDSFFEPSLDPMKEEEDGWDKFTHTAERLSLLAATSGWGGVVQVGYTRRDFTRIDQKRLNLTMNERVSVKRSIYPQANLKGLARLLRDAQGQVDLSRFVQEVTLNSDWFRNREAKAHSLVNFDADNVDSINATLFYNGRPQTLRLTKAGPTGTSKWPSVIVNNAMKREVEYEYRVNFINVDTAERPGVLVSPRMTTVGDEFELAPRNEGLYFQDEIQFGADALPWDRYSNVAVEVRYEDPPNAIRLAETFLLSQATTQATWKRFRRNPALTDYQVQVSFLAIDDRDIIGDWQTTDTERFLIRDPRPMKRTVTVTPGVTWGLVTMVFVELSYSDPENNVNEQQTLSFFNTDQDRNPKLFSVNLVNPDQRLVRYKGSILLSDNRLIPIPPSATMDMSIFIRADMMGHRIVTVRPASIDFVGRGIRRVEAHMAFIDATAGLRFENVLTFTSAGETRFFEYDYVNAGNSSYTCKMKIVFANGLTQDRNLGTLNSEELLLSV